MRQLGAAADYRAIFRDKKKKTRDQSPYNCDWSSGNRSSINDKERQITTDYDTQRYTARPKTVKFRIYEHRRPVLVIHPAATSERHVAGRVGASGHI